MSEGPRRTAAGALGRSGPRVLGGQAAVDDHGVADGETGGVGAEPQHGRGDLLRAPEAADGHAAD